MSNEKDKDDQNDDDATDDETTDDADETDDDEDEDDDTVWGRFIEKHGPRLDAHIDKRAEDRAKAAAAKKGDKDGGRRRPDDRSGRPGTKRSGDNGKTGEPPAPPRKRPLLERLLNS